MCREECVALLDHSYHTVLSSKSETPLNVLLMEGLLKRRWLNRPPQPQVAVLDVIQVQLVRGRFKTLTHSYVNFSLVPVTVTDRHCTWVLLILEFFNFISKFKFYIEKKFVIVDFVPARLLYLCNVDIAKGES